MYNMELLMPIKEIGCIYFGVYSAEEIQRNSVVNINNPSIGGPNSIYDDRMGICIDGGLKLCVTCGLDIKKQCPGHFGHIQLNQHILHPLYTKNIVSFLSVFCIKCCRLLLSEDYIDSFGLNRYQRRDRFDRIIREIDKVDICWNCNNTKPKIRATKEGTICMSYKQKEKNGANITLEVEEIEKIFESISDSDVKLLGLNPSYIQPKNLIISSLPVLPPCSRPPIFSDGKVCDDDLTSQYIEIVKINNNLGKSSRELSDAKKQKYIQSLIFRVSTLFDNSKGLAKIINDKRPIKCIRTRLTGKKGLIRENLMGKRCEKTARTVIGPDPTLKLGELAVPREIANNLTIPERVTKFNIDYLTKLINNGDANFVVNNTGKTINLQYAMFRKGTELLYDDVIVRRNEEGKEVELRIKNKNFPLKKGDIIRRNGEFITNILLPEKRNFKLELGNVVNRHLRNGDQVIFNRQPTLHKGGMLGHKIVIRDHKTFRFNLAITPSFNADFDGDEMNVHVPSGPEAKVEIELLSSATKNIILPQNGKPNARIVQDSLLASYLMTKDPLSSTNETNMDRGKFFNISCCLSLTTDEILNKIEMVRAVYIEMGKHPDPFTGKGLFSLVLPDTFNYNCRNDTDPLEPVVKIKRGVLYEGTMSKMNLGSTYQSIILLLHKEYSDEVCATFINNIQFLTNNWLTTEGFSVGLGDCIATKTDEINTIIEKAFLEAEGLNETTRNPKIREIRINASLNKAKDSGLRIAKDALEHDNGFISMVRAGSKGDYFNIAQITGLLGQQNLWGERIPELLNQCTRTLPCYPHSDLSVSEVYESRGFISHSFVHGLNPQEFFFHAMAGREGVSNTALGTQSSGYMQRRMVKCLEDIRVEYDGTVRSSNGIIYQFVYGGNGYDPSRVIRVDGDRTFVDVDRVVDRLNTEFELDNVC